jgi:hypothetical protein
MTLFVNRDDMVVLRRGQYDHGGRNAGADRHCDRHRHFCRREI